MNPFDKQQSEFIIRAKTEDGRTAHLIISDLGCYEFISGERAGSRFTLLAGQRLLEHLCESEHKYPKFKEVSLVRIS